MASFLDKAKVNTALDSRTKFDLGCDHISTASWMQFTPVFNKELVPKEKIDVKMETFSRMLPLNYPTFGRANIHNTAFFVPYRVVFPGWNDFITDSVHIDSVQSVGGILNSVPRIGNDYLVEVLFTNSAFSGKYSTVVTGSNPVDYEVYSSNAGGTVGYKLTNKGRQVVKILYSLGYNFIPSDNVLEYYSALPLLCAMRIYIDWYYPQAYSNTQVYQSLMSLVKYDNSSSQFDLDRGQIDLLLDSIAFVNYDSDYFVSAWDNPTAPNTGNFSNVNIVDLPNGYTANGRVQEVSASTVGNGTPTVSSVAAPTNVGSARPVLTQYLVDSLKKLTDYMKRHQLVGSKAIDRYLARFGVQLSDDKIDRSYQIGRQMVQIQIGDVMSTADSTGAVLGDYAGKGLAYGDGHFDFETDEYGQFIIISSIVPAIGYYQGIDRNVKHITKLDFWTPEFDNLGTQPITADELYITKDASNTGLITNLSSQIFGWIPRYAEYKVARDRVTGDFRYDSMNTGDDAWYLMRQFNDVSWQGVSQMVHSVDFVQGNDNLQYNRIFNTGNDNSDAFKMIYHFEIGDYAPMKALYDTYDFEDKGSTITADVNGVKVN